MFMSEIAKLQALEILDSRGNPTLAVTVTLAKEPLRRCVILQRRLDRK